MSEVKVNADVRIVPAKRSASYDVPIESDRVKPRIVLAKTNSGDVAISCNWDRYAKGSVKIPKTLEAIDALAALVDAVRAELVEQGVES